MHPLFYLDRVQRRSASSFSIASRFCARAITSAPPTAMRGNRVSPGRQVAFGDTAFMWNWIYRDILQTPPQPSLALV
jgi:hypothetical protein